MRSNGMLGCVAAAAIFTLLALVAGCRSHSESPAAMQPQTRSVADIARSVGLELNESPRNATRLQAEQPAAAAVRGGGEGIEQAFDQTAAANTASTQPGPDDWSIIVQSLSLFQHAPYLIDLLLGFALSIAMALMLTAWPKSLAARDPVEATDERNGAVILGLVGCLAAELVQSSERLTLGAEIALVLFGIGGLIRFRTVFGDPRRTGLMILITILGLCNGMSQYALAVLAFVIIWMVRYFLLSSVRLLINVRVRRGSDPEQVRVVATAAIQAHGAAILQSVVRKGGRTVQINARARGSINEADLTLALQDALPGARVRVSAS